MKRLVTATVVLIAAVCLSESASAQQPGGIGGFLPYGFYQPYGARYGNSVQTPPYFALNPPVYYGARYARPYGMSPFASPPVVTAPSSYRGRLQTLFHDQPAACVSLNPHITQSKVVSEKLATVGDIRANPFVDSADRIAKK